MTTRALAFWYAHDQGGEHLATTAEEIDAALDHVASLVDDHGAVATVVRRGDEGPALYVGLHGQVGALYYTNANDGFYSQAEPPDQQDRPDRAVTAHTPAAPLTYDWQSNEFPYPPDAEVPVAVVRAAVHAFAHSGARPAGIRWQEWEAPVIQEGTVLDDDDPAWG